MTALMLHTVAACLHVIALVMAIGLGNALAKDAATGRKTDAFGIVFLIVMTAVIALAAFTLQVIA